MKITSATVGPFQENTYLVVDESSNSSVIVDPGDEGPRLLKLIADSGAELKAIWLTHGHVDHIGGIASVKAKYDVPIHLHPADRPVYNAQAFYAESYGIAFDPPPPPDVEIADGDILKLGNLDFTVMHVPGHAPGHVIYICETTVMGGDLLFAGSIGRTDLPLASPDAMAESLKKISKLDPQSVFYPGHGPKTTLSTELISNPFLNGTAHVKRNAF